MYLSKWICKHLKMYLSKLDKLAKLIIFFAISNFFTPTPNHYFASHDHMSERSQSQSLRALCEGPETQTQRKSETATDLLTNADRHG